VTVSADVLSGDRLRARLTERRPGEHLWVMTAYVGVDLERIAEVLSGEAPLTSDTVLALEGPGCYCCGRGIHHAAPRCPA
jgi:hypothetical protein